MNKKLRPIPYPAGNVAKRRHSIEAWLFLGWIKTPQQGRARIAALNQKALNTPRRGEKCGAKTRKGAPCQCKALPAGRCKFHGGMSTGPKGKTKC